MAHIFQDLDDWETASYFHKRCLDISIEFKYIEGEAEAYKGLGICEEKVLNKAEAMEQGTSPDENSTENDETVENEVNYSFNITKFYAYQWYEFMIHSAGATRGCRAQ